MNVRATTAVTRAIVLAAGNGDRFKTASGQSKLVRPVLGIPLIIRTLNSAAHAGIRDAEIVLGYQADDVRALVLRDKPAELSVHFHVNERWHEENGLSVLAARGAVDGERFALLMGDHLFDNGMLRRLLSTPGADAESTLGIDRRHAPPAVSEEATRVRLDAEGRIVQIGKMLDPYDALDTGLFVCTATLFEALDESCSTGDTTLSGGVRRLASRGLVRGIDIGDGVWWDIDTVEDLRTAEDLLLSQPA